MPIRLLLGCSILFVIVACQTNRRSEPNEALTQTRAERFGNLDYDLRFEVPAAVDEPIRGRLLLTLTAHSKSEPLVLDYLGGWTTIEKMTVNLHLVPVRGWEDSLTISSGDLVLGRNVIEIEFRANPEAFFRQEDLLFTRLGPRRAHYLFPCLDQPNLKGRFSLRLGLPDHFKGVANAPVMDRRQGNGRVELTFAQTSLLPPYRFGFAAGEFEVEAVTRGRRTIRFFHQTQDPLLVRRNRQEMFDLHYQALEWLEEYTGIEYPFDKLDFLAIEGLDVAGLEHPGLLYYNRRHLLLGSSSTRKDRLDRAHTIAEQIARLWFGNFVTVESLTDLWWRNALANVMAEKIIGPNHLRLLTREYPRAHRLDRMDSQNNRSNWLAARGPIVLRFLERKLGPEAWQAAIQLFLSRHQLGNASFHDLQSAFQSHTKTDLQPFWEAWLRLTGRPVLTTRLESDSLGQVTRLNVQTSGAQGQLSSWPQPVTLTLVYSSREESFLAELTGDSWSMDCPPGLALPEYVFPNSDGRAYGHFLLGAHALEGLRRRVPHENDPARQAGIWLALWVETIDGRLRPKELCATGLELLTHTEDELVAQRVLTDLEQLFWQRLSRQAQREIGPRFEATLWQRIDNLALPRSLRLTLWRGYLALVSTDKGLARLWAREMPLVGITLDEAARVDLALQLAVRKPARAASILKQAKAQGLRKEARAKLAFLTPVLVEPGKWAPSFLERLPRLEGQTPSAWLVTAAALLHHPTRTDQSLRFLNQSLQVAQTWFQTRRDPLAQAWLRAVLGGHRTPNAWQIAHRYLGPDGLPEGELLEASDHLRPK